MTDEDDIDYLITDESHPSERGTKGLNELLVLSRLVLRRLEKAIFNGVIDYDT